MRKRKKPGLDFTDILRKALRLLKTAFTQIDLHCFFGA